MKKNYPNWGAGDQTSNRPRQSRPPGSLGSALSVYRETAGDRAYV